MTSLRDVSICRMDTEARSDVDITGKKNGPKGSGRYFESPHFRPLIARWRIDDEPMEEWLAGQPCPESLRRHAAVGGMITGWNVSFERRFLRWLELHENWPAFAIDRFCCTSAAAAAMGLPRSLESAAEALGLSINKDKRGKTLIQLFSVPRKPRPNEPPGIYFVEPHERPDDFRDYSAYCAQDVEVEAAVAVRTIPLSAAEQAAYVLDQRINDRGLRIDRVSCIAAMRLAEAATLALDVEIRDLTGGAVRRVSDVSRLVAWVQNRGVELNSAQKADLVELLRLTDLPADVRRAIEIRQEGGKTSTTKFKAFLDYASPVDDRIRHIYTYHAASTGRWQARGVNMNNLPRPRREFDDALQAGELRAATLFGAIRHGDPRVLRDLYGDALGRPLHLLSDAIRGFLWAAPGCEYKQADYSGIEGAVIAWSSEERWKINAMAAIIADEAEAKLERRDTRLADMYVRSAAGIMSVPEESIRIGKRKGPNVWMRQSIGKVSELALGFGGGVTAFHSMSLNYGVDLEPLYAPVWAAADEERRTKAVRRYEANLKRGKEKTDLLSRNAWIACELIKVGWRATNPAIATGWRLREEAIRNAVRHPGVETSALCFRYVVKMGYLWARLPSGRCLAYGAPRLRDQVWVMVRLDDGNWGDAEVMTRVEAETLERQGQVQIQGATSPAITILGVDKSGKRMQREPLYGGLIAENDTQAIARDLLVNGMLRAEAAGYQIVGHVYDEILAEAPPDDRPLAEFERLICELPPWAAGLPLTAGGWRGKRYRKD